MLIAILSYSDAWYFERVIRANFTARKREETSLVKTLVPTNNRDATILIIEIILTESIGIYRKKSLIALTLKMFLLFL